MVLAKLGLLFFTSFCLPHRATARSVQVPLGVASNFDLPFEKTPAFKELRNKVGDRLFRASPIAKPCYAQPDPAIPSECDRLQQRKTADSFISDQPGGYFYGNWASCQASAESCAIPLNDSEVPPNKNCSQGNVPDYVIDIQNAEDIQDAFRFAQDTRTPLVIKNTGHDWKGRSAGAGSLALWTHHLRSPKVPIRLDHKFIPLGCKDQVEETVFHYGAGETWAGAYKFANESNLAVVGGTCGTVGIAGWLHGGGHSPLTPNHGMGADNLREIEIVTPKGEVKVANECLNADIFFAVRGGGGSTFGVVTKFAYKALPVFAIHEFTVNATKFSNLNDSDVREMLDILINNAISWSKRGWGGYIKPGNYIQIVKNASSSPTEAEEDLATLISFLKGRNIDYILQPRGSWYDYQLERYAPTPVHIGTWGGAAASRLLPADVFTQARLRLTEELLNLYNQKMNLIIMLVAPTAFAHTTTSALHPGWKDAIWQVRINDKWDPYFDESSDASRKHFETVHNAMKPLRKLTPGAAVSISEADIWEPDHKFAFWGEKNARRLETVKAQVDPENLLSTYMAVGWKEKDERYRCYPISTDRL